MKIVAVSRSLNEEDIVEAFIRHHASFVDHHVILDGGSVDNTVEIITNLKNEGLNITLFSNDSPINNEHGWLTFLYKWAIEQNHADWVLFLDIDEFIDARKIGWDIKGYFDRVGESSLPINVFWRTYSDDICVLEHETNVVKRL
ncbi:MAG: glycosyltransferase family 2 protein, partial [Alphaproteobacteria bacterium]|nr:glycosyltransferase family 2 protein [Alphaproteobacteria bacterium]